MEFIGGLFEYNNGYVDYFLIFVGVMFYIGIGFNDGLFGGKNKIGF